MTHEDSQPLLDDAALETLEAELADDMEEFRERADFAAAWEGR